MRFGRIRNRLPLRRSVISHIGIGKRQTRQAVEFPIDHISRYTLEITVVIVTFLDSIRRVVNKMAPDKLDQLVFLVIIKSVSRIESTCLIPVPIEVFLRKVRQEQVRGGIGCLVIEVDLNAGAKVCQRALVALGLAGVAQTARLPSASGPLTQKRACPTPSAQNSLNGQHQLSAATCATL